MMVSPFSVDIEPNWEGFVKCLRREGTPKRVHFIELIIDGEIQDVICQRFGLLEGLNPNDPYYWHKHHIRLQSFLGYDYIVAPGSVGESVGFMRQDLPTVDTAPLQRHGGRYYVNEHRGMITSWEEFEAYPWPDPEKYSAPSMEWFQKNLPDNMCMIGGLVGSIYENISFLMGYETLCYALYEQRDLVRAISEKVVEAYRKEVEYLLQFDRVKAVWGSDDLGFKTGTLISPKDLREFVFPGHKLLADMSHAAGRLYIMHNCGKLDGIMPDLLDDVHIDGKHSFEDTIEDVCEVKGRLGHRMALLGGIDVDFLCRSSEEAVRQRVRQTLACCQPGGGYCLGTGNTVANYIPVENYLSMLDEGRRFTA